MRKLIYSIFALLISLNMYAQTNGGEINRKSKVENHKKQNHHPGVRRGATPNSQNGIRRIVDGIILGISTKQDVIAHLKSKNMPYKFIEGNNVLLSFKDNSFGGVMWFAIYYRFSKNIVYKITYSKYANNNDVFNTNIDSEFSALKNSLYNKYKPYKTEETYKRLLSNTILFDDAKTEIEIGKGYYQGSYLLNLVYTDLYYQNKDYDNRDSEL